MKLKCLLMAACFVLSANTFASHIQCDPIPVKLKRSEPINHLYLDSTSESGLNEQVIESIKTGRVDNYDGSIEEVLNLKITVQKMEHFRSYIKKYYGFNGRSHSQEIKVFIMNLGIESTATLDYIINGCIPTPTNKINIDVICREVTSLPSAI